MPLPTVPSGPARIKCLCCHCDKTFHPNLFDVFPVPNMNPGQVSSSVRCPFCKEHGPLAPHGEKELAIHYFVQRYAVDAENRNEN